MAKAKTQRGADAKEVLEWITSVSKRMEPILRVIAILAGILFAIITLC